MKKRIVTIIFVSVLLLTIFGGFTLVYRNKGVSNVKDVITEDEEVVKTSEIAIKMAKEALKEHFLEYDSFENMDFEATEDGHIWIVRRKMDPPTYEVDGEDLIFSLGGGYCVHIQKSDGKVLSVKIED